MIKKLFPEKLALSFAKRESNVPENGYINVNAFSPAVLYAYVENKLKQKEGFAVATVNLDHMVKLSSDAPFLMPILPIKLLSPTAFPLFLSGGF